MASCLPPCRGANYFEVDVDIGSSSVAASVTNLVAGATKSLAVDMGVLVEGKSSEQLPEQLIGTIRCGLLPQQSRELAYFPTRASKCGALAVMRSEPYG